METPHAASHLGPALPALSQVRPSRDGAPTAPPTHVALDGGRFYVPGAHADAVLALYARALRSGAPLALAEAHRYIGPVVIDLDFRQPTPGRRWSDAHVARFAAALLQELDRLVDMEALPPDARRAFVLAKPAPRPAAKGPGFKDGLHLQVPGVVTRPQLQLALRAAMLPHVRRAFGALFASDAPFDEALVYDEAVIERNAWLLFGSKKPDEPHPWALVAAYEWDPELMRAEPRPDVAARLVADARASDDGARRLVELLSIRNKYAETRLTPEGRARLDALLAAKAEEAARAALEAADGADDGHDVHDAPDEARLEALLALLDDTRADSYQDWRRVGLALHHATGGSADGLRLWDAFSRRCASKYDGAQELRRLWDRMAALARAPPGGRRAVTVASLCWMAKADDPDGYAAWKRAARATALVRSRPQALCAADGPKELAAPCADHTAPVNTMAIAEALSRMDARLADQLEASGGVVRPRADGGALRFHLGPEGTEDAASAHPDRLFNVVAAGDPPRFVGSLGSGAVVQGPLGAVHQNLKDIRAPFVFDAPDAQSLVLKAEGVTPEARIDVQHPFDSNLTFCKVVALGKAVHATPKGTRALMGAITQAVNAHVERRFGITVNVFNNNGVVNNFKGQDDNDVRPDADIGRAWLDYLANCDEEERGTCKIAYSLAGNYVFYSRDTGLWGVSRDQRIAANYMADNMARSPFWDTLSASEQHKLGMDGGRRAVLNCMLHRLRDDRLESKLDSNLDLLPFTNGCVDLTTGVFRALRWDDFVQTTTGYEYAPQDTVCDEDAAFIRTFYEQVLPVPEEREVFLRAAAAALSGNRSRDKFMLVCTDKRGGNNGKSTALKALKPVLGSFFMSAQDKVLYTGATEGANSHSSNELAFRGHRLALLDESSNQRSFDIAKIKRITGGGLDAPARGAGDKHVTEFQWTALLFVGCNEGNLPQLNALDDALLKRLIVVPFRAKFEPEPVPDDEPFTFACDPELKARLEDARLAHLHLLLEAHQRYRQARGLGPLPEGCLEWRNAMVADSDPRLEKAIAFIQEHVNFTLVRRPDQRGHRVLGGIERADLIRRLKAATDRSLWHGALEKQVKGIVEKAMVSFGRKLCREVQVGGVTLSNAFKDCAWFVPATESDGF